MHIFATKKYFASDHNKYLVEFSQQFKNFFSILDVVG